MGNKHGRGAEFVNTQWQERALNLIDAGDPECFLYLAADEYRAERVRKLLLNGRRGILGSLPVLTLSRFARETVENSGCIFQRFSHLESRLVFHLLCQEASDLQVLHEIIHHPGTVRSLFSAISELRRAGLSPDSFAEAVAALSKGTGEGLEEGGPAIQPPGHGAEGELLDLISVWRRWEELTGILRDREDLYRVCVGALPGDARWDLLVVEGAEFTQGELELLQALGQKSERVFLDFSRFSSPPDPSAAGVLGEMMTRARRFLPGAVVIEPRAAKRPDVSLIIYPNEALEVEGAVRYLKSRLLSGDSPDDFEIACPGDSRYLQLLDRLAREFEVPLRLAGGGRTPLIVRLVETLLQAAQGWGRNEVLQLLKSPYVSLGVEYDSDLIEQYALSCGVSAGWEQWARIPRRPGIQEPLDKLGELLDFPGEALLDTYCSFLREKLAALDCEKQLLTGPLIHGDYDLAGRELRALRAVERALSALPQAARAAGMTGPVSFSAFVSLARIGLEGLIVGEGGEDGGIRVRSFTDFASADAPELLLLGFVEGQLPPSEPDDWLLRPRFRRHLREKGFFVREAKSRAREAWLRERLLSAKRIRVSAPSLCSGEEQGLSPYLRTFEERVPGLCPEGCPTEIPELQPPRQLIRAALSGDTVAVEHLTASEGQEVARLSRRIQTELHREGEFFGPEDGLLGSGLAGEMEQRFAAAFSPSQLSDYGQCPFKFFCRHVLKGRELPDGAADLSPLDKGTLLHEILYRFYQSLGRAVTTETLSEARRQMTATALEVLDAYGAQALSAARWKLQKDEILETLEAFLYSEADFGDKTGGVFQPLLLEYAFGFPGGPAPDALQFDTPSGKVSIKGKIDRIDLDGEGRYILYDYKSSKGAGIADFRRGTDVQIPLYLLAVPRLIALATKPVAGLYYVLRSGKMQGIWNKEEADGFGFKKKAALSCEQWEDLLEHVVELAGEFVARIKKGDFRVYPRECQDYCPYRDICRYDKNRIARKREPSEVNPRAI